ncbi:hypothetical protein C7974DRAFT_386011 [Boeremia exigua]|uniref:uncharacterized protein n=1 Tax=Boeremia exigua TaxID=749465 RepID=UPI001E8D566A|nr:uncharacterized protein C7974DRAFT_386011 [Boeremia exigua]KAH6642724.1 hypothetical protein C7974DRAFT_386011 [Boeremia exigua]
MGPCAYPYTSLNIALLLAGLDHLEYVYRCCRSPSIHTPHTVLQHSLGLTAVLVGECGFLLSNASLLAAFARDGGLPYREALSRVNSRTKTPVHALVTLRVGTFPVLLLALSPIASSIVPRYAFSLSSRI